jgi:hypothetical protein
VSRCTSQLYRAQHGADPTPRYNAAIAHEHLILCPGHAVWNLRDDPVADSSWYLRDFQRGEPRFYLEHIRRAVELAAADAGAILIFSGTQTFAAAGPRSESQGYWMLAKQFGWWGSPAARERATTEEFALDSLQNVLFSCCRFHEFTGEWPGQITVVGWGFKARRFVELHRAALRFPPERFTYIPVNDPAHLEMVEPEEAAHRALFAADPYGSLGSLAEKRVQRNPFQRCHGYRESCPELRALLDHRGPEPFSEPLPWDTL